MDNQLVITALEPSNHHPLLHYMKTEDSDTGAHPLSIAKSPFNNYHAILDADVIMGQIYPPSLHITLPAFPPDIPEGLPTWTDVLMKLRPVRWPYNFLP